MQHFIQWNTQTGYMAKETVLLLNSIRTNMVHTKTTVLFIMKIMNTFDICKMQSCKLLRNCVKSQSVQTEEFQKLCIGRESKDCLLN